MEKMVSTGTTAFLNESTSVQVIDPLHLEPGDIVVSSGSHLESWLIKTATAHDATHVAIHIGSGIGIEANDPGVVPVYFPAIAYAESAKLKVKRYSGLSPDQKSMIVQFVEGTLFRPYSTIGAIATILPFLRRQNDSGYFCSMLASAAYAAIDCSLTDETPSDATPGHVADSKELSDAPNAIREIPVLYHKAVAGGLQQTYEKYLSSSNIVERTIIPQIRSLGPTFKTAFNVFDIVLQLEELPDAQRPGFDHAIARIFRALGNKNYPFPGISIARAFAESGGGLTGDLAYRRPDLLKDLRYRVYSDGFFASLLAAMAYVSCTRFC
jgi:hypothetical protein